MFFCDPFRHKKRLQDDARREQQAEREQREKREREQEQEMKRLRLELEAMRSQVAELDNLRYEIRRLQGESTLWGSVIRNSLYTFVLHPSLSDIFRGLLTKELKEVVSQNDIISTADCTSLTLPATPDKMPAFELCESYVSPGTSGTTLWRLGIQPGSIQCGMQVTGKKVVSFKADLNVTFSIEGLVLVAIYPRGTEAVANTLNVPSAAGMITRVKSVTLDPKRTRMLAKVPEGPYCQVQLTLIELPRYKVPITSKVTVSTANVSLPVEGRIKSEIEKAVGKILLQEFVAPASMLLPLAVEFLDSAEAQQREAELPTKVDLQLQQVTRILGKDLKWDLSKEMCTALDTTKEKVQPLVSATGLGSSKGSRLAAAALLAAYIQLTMPDQHLEWTDLLEAASAHLNAQLDSERATALTQAAKHVVLGQPEHIVPLPKPKPPPKGAPAPSRASPASPVPRGAPAPPGAAPATGEGAAPAPVPVSEPVASPDPVVLGPGPSHAPRPSEPAMPETPQVAAMEATRRVSGLLSASSASAVSEPHEHTLGGSHGRTLSEPPTEATAEASDGEPGSPQLADAVMADAPDTDGLLQTSKSSSSSGRGMKGLMKKKFDGIKTDLETKKASVKAELHSKKEKPLRSHEDEVLAEVKKMLKGPFGKWDQTSKSSRGSLASTFCKAINVSQNATSAVLNATMLQESHPNRAASVATAALVVGYIQLTSMQQQQDWEELRRQAAEVMDKELEGSDVDVSSNVLAAAKLALLESGAVAL